MDSCVVICGKIGDVLSVISRLHHGSNLVISKRYASIAQGIPGITPHIYEGEWDDLEGAIKWAKRKFKRVLVPQTFGKDIPIRHLTPGFQHDQWLRMGAIEKNGSQPIQIPRNVFSGIGVAAKYLNDKPAILVADHSQSSQFEYREDLWKTLTEQFGATHNLIRLSEIKLDRFTDFLALYDKAQCLVSIDTAFLHLSAFSTVPTIALAAHKPQSWHGSSDTGRFRFYCRYSEYATRKDELIAAIKEAKPTVQTTPVKTAHPFGYNGSLIEFQGRRLIAYRYHSDPTKWRTQLALIDGDKEYDIKVPDSLAAESWEDPRLFIYKDKLHIGYVVSQCTAKAGGITPCVSGYGELAFKDGSWSIPEHIQPKYGKNDFTGQEKNFRFFEA